jgi:hypothetical protein
VVPFLALTSSATTCVNEDVMRALGVGDSMPQQLAVRVHGISITVQLGLNERRGLCILGANFFDKANATLSLMYGREALELTFSDK